jgi:hypothetical protein
MHAKLNLTLQTPPDSSVLPHSAFAIRSSSLDILPIPFIKKNLMKEGRSMHQRPSVPGFLWQVTADDKEYWLITAEEEYPAWLPSDHYAECWGGGMIFADAVENARVEQVKGLGEVVRTYEPGNPQRLVDAV